MGAARTAPTVVPMSSAPPADDGRVPRGVWSSTLLLAAGRLWSSACFAVLLLVLAWHLGQEEFGRLTFYLAAFALLEAVSDFGTGNAVLQRGGGSGAFAAALAAGRRIRLRLSALGALAIGLGALLADEPDGPWIALASLHALTRVPELSAVAFQRDIAWRVPVAVRALGALGRLVVVLLLVALGVGGAGPYLLVYGAGLGLGNLTVHALARERLPRAAPTAEALHSPRAPLGELWHAAWPLGLAGICQQLYFYVDNVYVRALCGDVVVGHYNAAVRLMSFLIMFAAFATSSALPWLVRRHGHGALGAAAVRLSLPLSVGAALLLGALWPWTGGLLRLVFPDEFGDAAGALRWLLVATAIVYVGSGLLTALIASGRSRAVLALTASALAVNLAGNALLVPRHGMDGAAAATGLTELWVAAGAWLLLRRGGIVLALHPAAWLAAPAAFALGALVSTALA